jgi:hypothetical protein
MTSLPEAPVLLHETQRRNHPSIGEEYLILLLKQAHNEQRLAPQVIGLQEEVKLSRKENHELKNKLEGLLKQVG